jgi:hypothetical protein
MPKNIVAGLACLLLVLPACNEKSSESETDTNVNPTPGAQTTDDGTETAGTPTTTEGTTTEECPDPTEAGPPNAMEKFGASCEEDADCVKILGPDGKCLKDILGLYGLPGGYCSLLCDLPPGIGYQDNDPICGEGVTCIGVDGYFEGCVVECTDDSQCPREGYVCRTMPQIGMPCDQKFCLMTDDNML